MVDIWPKTSNFKTENESGSLLLADSLGNFGFETSKLKTVDCR
jgi:hypothetical protein